jgi:hypothetical protein
MKKSFEPKIVGQLLYVTPNTELFILNGPSDVKTQDPIFIRHPVKTKSRKNVLKYFKASFNASG